MTDPGERDAAEDWTELVARARERIARDRERRESVEPPGPEADFLARYEHLVGELSELLSTIPELDVEPHGPSGMRVAFPPSDREVRVTALEDQGLVHFVFGHTTLGTLHRAEHHASRPFGEARPEVPRLARQLLDFLVEGIEPRWLSRRPAGPKASPDPAPDGPLELPLD